MIDAVGVLGAFSCFQPFFLVLTSLRAIVEKHKSDEAVSGLANGGAVAAPRTP